MKLNEIKHFKNMMKDYQYYFEKFQDCLLEKMEIEAKLGLHSIQYGEMVQGSQDTLMKNQAYIDKLEMLDRIEMKINKAQKLLEYINKFISNCEYGESCKLIYCLNQSTISEEAKKHCISVKALKLNIDKAIDEYLNELPSSPY